ncbi:MAG: adenylate/guanylate cyclase domain-containing protein [Acidimicrobiales bacterium]
MTDGEISYAPTADGSFVAYRQRGDGPVDLVEYGGFGTMLPFDTADDQPRWRRFEERLERFCRFTRFDHRGVGYSDPIDRPTMETWVADGLAVLDAAEIERAHLLATGHEVAPALALAASHPDRVASLVLANGGARSAWAPDYPVGIRPDSAREMQSVAAVDSVDDARDLDAMAPSVAGDAEVRRWWSRYAKRGAGPRFARDHWELSWSADVRHLLPSVTQPMLVVCTTGSSYVPDDVSRWLADRAVDATWCPISAPDHLLWAVPGDSVSQEIEAFLVGTRSGGSGERSLVALLFSDIVDSTSRNAAVGDDAWVEQLARHDGLVADAVHQHGGRVVKHLGDGVLAVFALPSKAVDAALAVSAGANDLGMAVRAAVHAAEVEEVADDVHGLGVVIAARLLDVTGGGEVTTTRATFALLAGQRFSYESRGTTELKGVPGGWDVGLISRSPPR